MRTLTSPPDAELIGYYVLAFVDNMQAAEVKPIMEAHGLVDLVPDQWYPLHLWFGAFNEMLQHPNIMDNMVAIGMRIGEMIPVPPDVQEPTFENMLMAWGNIYAQAHRHGDIGAIRCEKVGDQHYRSVLTDPYPDDLTYGILYALAKRFLPPKTRFKVYYDPECPSRDRGGSNEVSILHVEW